MKDSIDQWRTIPQSTLTARKDVYYIASCLQFERSDGPKISGDRLAMYKFISRVIQPFCPFIRNCVHVPARSRIESAKQDFGQFSSLTSHILLGHQWCPLRFRRLSRLGPAATHSTPQMIATTIRAVWAFKLLLGPVDILAEAEFIQS